MKKSDAIAHFGSKAKFAREIGRAASTVTEYGEVLPLGIAMLVEKLSKGRVQVDYSLYDDLPPSLRQ